MDQPETALLLSETFYKKMSEEQDRLILKSTCAEPLWRLSRWDDVDKLIKEPGMKETNSWDLNCGQLLIDFRKGNHDHFKAEIQKVRFSLLRVLKTHESEQSLYQKCYSQILKLHMLTEIQKAEHLMHDISKSPSDAQPLRMVKELLIDWAARNELLQPTSQVMEPLLCLRRIILNEMKKLLNHIYEKQPIIIKDVIETVNYNIGQLWIQSTEFASKAKMYQQAELYVLNAETYKSQYLFIQKAKLSWEKGDQSNAFKVLERGINEIMQSIGGEVQKLTDEDCKLFGEARLLVAKYNAESMKVNPDFNSNCFKEAIHTYPKIEKGLFLYAEYLDLIYNAMPQTEQNLYKGQELLTHIVNFYGRSLMFGCNFVHQSMNRMLSIWLDCTARSESTFIKLIQAMNRLMQRYVDAIPRFMFFTAFSQLLSRICHPNKEVYVILRTLIVNLLLDFPQQSLWMILAVYKSTYENRVRRCKEILDDPRLNSIKKLIWDFNTFTEKLIHLTNADPTDERTRKSNIAFNTTVSKVSPRKLIFIIWKEI